MTRTKWKYSSFARRNGNKIICACFIFFSLSSFVHFSCACEGEIARKSMIHFFFAVHVLLFCRRWNERLLNKCCATLNGNLHWNFRIFHIVHNSFRRDIFDWCATKCSIRNALTFAETLSLSRDHCHFLIFVFPRANHSTNLSLTAVVRNGVTKCENRFAANANQSQSLFSIRFADSTGICACCYCLLPIWLFFRLQYHFSTTIWAPDGLHSIAWVTLYFLLT